MDNDYFYGISNFDAAHMSSQEILNRLILNPSFEETINNYNVLLESSYVAYKATNLKLELIAEHMKVPLPTLKYRLKTKSFKPDDLLLFYKTLYKLSKWRYSLN